MDSTAQSGMYLFHPAALEDSVTAYCDFDTDSGGWTVLYAATGADDEAPITSDVATMGDPSDGATFVNLNRAAKAALSSAGPAPEVLLWRSATAWLRVTDCGAHNNAVVFDASLAAPGPHERILQCTVTAADGSTSPGVVAWSTVASPEGGDFAVLAGANAVFDRSSPATAPLRNSGCQGHLLYSASGGTADGDAAYSAAVALGTWFASAGAGSCAPGDSFEGAGEALRVAVRPAPRGDWLPLLRGAHFEAGRTNVYQPPPSSVVSSYGATTIATALRIQHREGAFACDAAHADVASWPWDGCAADVVGTEEGFSLRVMANGETLLSSLSTTQLPPQCHVPQQAPAGGSALTASQATAGGIHCSVDELEVEQNHVFAIHSAAVFGAEATGHVRFDVDAFVEHTCPPLPVGPSGVAAVSCESPYQWVRVLSDAALSGAGPAVAATVELPGAGAFTVRRFRAVHKSGYITNDINNAIPQNGWGARLVSCAALSA